MPLVQVFTPKGSVSEASRQEISSRLVAEVMKAEGAPDNEAARSISWLLWHDVEEWWVGPEPVPRTDPPRYLVRVDVPAGSLDVEGKRSEIVERVTAVLAKSDQDPDRLAREPAAWVLIDEVPEGNWGSHGRIVRYPEIEAFMGAGT